jgi:prepilin-type N-terminal cleavage/methylation domain-containing protein
MRWNRARAFTLIELLVVVAIIGVLIAILIPSLGKVKQTAVRSVCAANLKGQGTSFSAYAAQYSDQVPISQAYGAGMGGINWLWDEEIFFGDQLLAMNPQVSSSSMKSTSARKLFYCPSNHDQNVDGLWNFAAIRVMGYTYFNDRGSNFTGNIAFTPARATLQKYNRKFVSVNRASVVEMAFCTFIQDSNTLSFTSVKGGWAVPHTSAHLKGTLPMGHNVLCCDGHVEWRPFFESKASYVMNSPRFWIANP